MDIRIFSPDDRCIIVAQAQKRYNYETAVSTPRGKNQKNLREKKSYENIFLSTY